MEPAKAIINLKDGIIELEGPVEFVEKYLNTYQSIFTEGAGEEEGEDHEGEKGARVAQRARRGPCIEAIRNDLEVGFFDKPKSPEAVKTRLTEQGVTCTSPAVKAGLKLMVQEGRMSRVRRGRAFDYQRSGQ